MSRPVKNLGKNLKHSLSLSSIKYTKPNSRGYEAQTSLTCVCVLIAEYTQVIDSADFWSRQKAPLQVN